MPSAQLYYAIAAYYHECAGDLIKAEDFLLLALSVASRCTSDIAKIKPLNGLAIIEWDRGNYSKGLQLAKETYRIGRASGSIGGELDGVRLQALCYSSLGDFKQSLELLDEGKGLIVRVGLQGGEMENLLMNIEATVYQDKTEYSNARRIQEAILHKTCAELSPRSHAYALVNIASIDIITGASTDVVSRNLNAAMTAFQKGHYPQGIFICEYCHADLQHREGDATGAGVEYIRLFFATRDSDNELAWYCVAKLADLTNPVRADTESARWAFVFLAFALRPQVRSTLTVHQALRRLGDTLVGQGMENTALNILAIALDGFTQMDVHQGRAECMCTIGDVYMQHGDLSKAREMWEAARPLFERSEQRKGVGRIDERLQTLGVAQKLEALPKAELPAPQIPLEESDAEGEEPHSIPGL
jgi:tetratricopeptide (TPR) repeat protein